VIKFWSAKIHKHEATRFHNLRAIIYNNRNDHNLFSSAAEWKQSKEWGKVTDTHVYSAFSRHSCFSLLQGAANQLDRKTTILERLSSFTFSLSVTFQPRRPINSPLEKNRTTPRLFLSLSIKFSASLVWMLRLSYKSCGRVHESVYCNWKAPMDEAVKKRVQKWSSELGSIEISLLFHDT